MKKDVGYHQELALTGIGCLLISYLVGVKWYAVAGVIFIVLGMVISPLRKWNGLAWKFLNRITSAIGEFILLFIVYFFVVTPIGLIYRLVRSNKPKTNSTLVDSETVYTVENLKKTW